MRRAVIAGVLALLVGCGDEEAATAPPTDALTATVALAPLTPNGACDEPRLRRHDPMMHVVTDAMGIFRRPQRPSDAAATGEVQGIPADDMSFEATRRLSGLRERVIVVPTHTVKESCSADPAHLGPPGVCVIRDTASRCFDMRAITEGRAAALSDAEQVIGLVPDGIDRAIVEVDGDRAESAVVDNAYRARVPSGAEARITLVRQSLDGCEPSPAMRAAAPTLDHPPDPGGVPEIVRRSVRFDVDSRIAARHARIWDPPTRSDDIAYWIVPHLRCEVAGLESDSVCVTPVKASYTEAPSACVEPGKTAWIHFPDGDVSAIAGFAPPDARQAVVRVEGGTVVLPVTERVYAGRLEGIPLEGEVGRARVEFR